MSFLTQRLTNRFPLWTKIRNDPSSMGSRLFDTFAEGLEENNITVKRLTNDLTLTKRDVGRSFLYEILLDEEDWLEPVSNASGYSWEYPTVTGTIGVDTYTLEKADSLPELQMSFPTRLSEYSQKLTGGRAIWDSSNPFTYNTVPYPERLWIVIEDSTFYVDKTINTDRDKSGLSAIKIEGIDQDFNVISEVVNIYDDGIYVSALAYREVTQIVTEGFNGTVTVSAGPVNNTYEPDPYRTLVFDDMEGALQLHLTSAAESFVTYKANRFKLGRQYRRPGTTSETNTEELCDLLLLDSDENTYEAIALAVNPANTYLYVLDVASRIHVYDHSLPEFVAPVTNDSTTSYVQLTAVRPYAKYGNTEYLWTRFERVRHPIAWIKIKRIDPAGTVLYLQPDKVTWDVAESEISYPISGRHSVDQWKDFRFETEYNLTGMWEYALTVKTAVDETVYVTSVMCGALVAEVSIDIPDVVNPEMLYFGDSGLLTVDNGTVAYAFNEHVDRCLFDERSHKVYLSDQYDTVTVT